jgi:hypothetical protein
MSKIKNTALVAVAPLLALVVASCVYLPVVFTVTLVFG